MIFRYSSNSDQLIKSRFSIFRATNNENAMNPNKRFIQLWRNRIRTIFLLFIFARECKELNEKVDCEVKIELK